MDKKSKKLVTDLFNANQRRVVDLVTQKAEPEKIARLIGLGLPLENSTYESASLVMALQDRRTLVEVCIAPVMISIWSESKNPLFEK